MPRFLDSKIPHLSSPPLRSRRRERGDFFPARRVRRAPDTSAFFAPRRESTFFNVCVFRNRQIRRHGAPCPTYMSAADHPPSIAHSSSDFPLTLSLPPRGEGTPEWPSGVGFQGFMNGFGLPEGRKIFRPYGTLIPHPSVSAHRLLSVPRYFVRWGQRTYKNLLKTILFVGLLVLLV